MKPFGLYVHIPYCVQKCPYCDFNSYGVGLTGASEFESDYISALIAELNIYSRQARWNGRPLQSIFFGGGTPSLFSATSYNRLFEAIRSKFPFQKSVEITLEANPGTVQEDVDIEKLIGYRAVGFNRISFGSQSFQTSKLKFLGRLHQPSDNASAVGRAREAGFENINCDLIFGVENESEEDWHSDLSSALSLCVPHISAYTLTIERGTVFDRQWRAGAKLVADEEHVATLYRTTQRRLSAGGYRQYEVSNYARPGYECVHNQNYWRRVDYLGLGAGAHSFIGGHKQKTAELDSHQANPHYGERWSNIPAPADYIRRALSEGPVVSRSEALTQEQALMEFFFLRVRFGEGFRLEELEEQFDLSRTKIDSTLSPVIAKLAQDGLVDIEQSHVRLRAEASLLADAVVQALSDVI